MYMYVHLIGAIAFLIRLVNRQRVLLKASGKGKEGRIRYCRKVRREGEEIQTERGDGMLV